MTSKCKLEKVFICKSTNGKYYTYKFLTADPYYRAGFKTLEGAKIALRNCELMGVINIK